MACAFWLAAVSTAGATGKLRGVALVVGNSAYEHLTPLANPQNDARDVEALLDSLGFDTSVSTDRDARRLARDLERFAEDARDADVAVLYYSGHGIEAGGENYLIPVDADISALDAAQEKLVPVGALIAKLQAAVPVTIVMLDACRTNPFPAGAMVRKAPGAEPAPIGTGLGEARGARPMPRAGGSSPADASIGTVIAFAAAPGQAALDGDVGGNSPYAAAILRHLDTMRGEEFGTVMRMVAEEVYLKTNGRQRPWINESLRRLLYFGKAPAEPTGEEGDILKERRQLLLTIAALPDADRKQIEASAAGNGVPMDALYAMLRAMGASTPKDPAELDKLLREQADRLKGIMAERDTLRSADPEIQRLAGLSDIAIREGALTTAIALNERAKIRLNMLMSTLDAAEADLRQRRIEAAEVYARSAQAYELNLDFLQAAGDYGQAFGQVEKWDENLAWHYKNAEMVSLTSHGYYKGDNEALKRAIAAGEKARDIADKTDGRARWALTQSNLGNALVALGLRESGTARLEEAVAAYRAALREQTRERTPLDWARTQGNLGTALWALGQRDSGTVRLEEAIAAYRAVLGEQSRERAPLDWAQTQNNLGNALATLGQRESSTARLEEAVGVYRAALQERTRERVPLDWAQTQNNLSLALSELGQRQEGTATLEEAVAAYRDVLRELTRERVPLDWAQVMSNLGDALGTLGLREGGTARLEEAVAAYRAALEERTREREPLDWASTQNNLGNALRVLGQRETGTARLQEAVAAFRAALEERTRERVPLDWAQTQSNLGAALEALGGRESGTASLEAAIAAHEASLLERTRQRVPLDWALTQFHLAKTLDLLGQRGSGPDRVRSWERAIAAWQSVQTVQTKRQQPGDWAYLQNAIGNDLILIGEQEDNLSRFQQAVPVLREGLDALDGAAYVSANLCRALLGVGSRMKDRAVLLEARQQCETALVGKKANGDAASAGETEGHLEKVDNALAALP